MGWNGKKWDECIVQSACIMGDVWGRLCTGSVSDCKQSLDFISQYKDYNFCGRQWLGISCKALTSMASQSLDLLSQIITTMSFDDKKRLSALIGELKSEKKSGLVSSGRDYAIKRARSLWSPNQALQEILWGLSQLQTVKDYTKTKPEEIEPLLKEVDLVLVMSVHLAF